MHSKHSAWSQSVTHVSQLCCNTRLEHNFLMYLIPMFNLFGSVTSTSNVLFGTQRKGLFRGLNKSKKTHTHTHTQVWLLTQMAANQTSRNCPEQNAPLPRFPTQSCTCLHCGRGGLRQHHGPPGQQIKALVLPLLLSEHLQAMSGFLWEWQESMLTWSCRAKQAWDQIRETTSFCKCWSEGLSSGSGRVCGMSTTSLTTSLKQN